MVANTGSGAMGLGGLGLPLGNVSPSSSGIISGLPNLPTLNPATGQTTFQSTFESQFPGLGYSQRVSGFKTEDGGQRYTNFNTPEATWGGESYNTRPSAFGDYQYLAPPRYKTGPFGTRILVYDDPVSNYRASYWYSGNDGSDTVGPKIKDIVGFANGGMVDNQSGPAPLGLGAEMQPAMPPSEEMDDTDQVVAATVMALDPESKIKEEDRRFIVELFVEMFGEEALQQLLQELEARQGGAQSDGQSDSIPAMIDGQQPAALSEGEFVVPADAVSGLGNGSTEAGSRRLMDMVNKIRVSRNGSEAQPAPVNPGAVMPGYADGGVVTRGPTPREVFGYAVPHIGTGWSSFYGNNPFPDARRGDKELSISPMDELSPGSLGIIDSDLGPKNDYFYVKLLENVKRAIRRKELEEKAREKAGKKKE